MTGILGIDVGATGIKGAIVDPSTGSLLTERIKIKTPKPATPEAILESIKTLIKQIGFKGKEIGIGFPSIVKQGVVLSASNIDQSWIKYNIKENYAKGLKANVYVINDADAAGLAEMKFGKGKGMNGLVLFLTLGTGIGSAPFLDGKLLPNTEFGNVKYKKSVAEKYASNSARELKKMSFKAWGTELNAYLTYLEFLLSPSQIILGGGVSKNFDEYKQYLTLKTPVTNAELLNSAGVVGAAMAAESKLYI